VTLQDYLRVLRRGWLGLLVMTLLGVLAALALTALTPPTYVAQATVYVSVSGDETPTDLQTGQSFATQRALTYADLAETTAILRRAAAALGEQTTVDELRASVQAAPREGTSLIDVTASAEAPDAVAARADAVASALTAEAPLLDALQPTSPVRLAVVQSAAVPETAVTPRPRNNLIIGFAIGLVLGVAAVIVSDALSTRIRSSADLPPGLGLVTLTSMPIGPKKRSRHVSRTDARAESFRQLRANLLFGSDVKGTLAVAGVTGASDAHGVARQLASAFAEIGSEVVVVDVDLRADDGRRDKGGRRDETGTPLRGVADVLGGAAQVDDVVRLASGEKVYEVPAGHVDASSAQRMSTPAMHDLVEALRARFDHVLLACPPVIERSEASVVAKLAGSALVVVESRVTKRPELLLALELLAGVRVTSISVAIDHVRELDLGGDRVRQAGAVDPGRTTL
jgi:capsular polysaccharide biosynthesis protein